eukprot:Nk52_evm1s2034 gene=Nk52_evmTU1s2034
MKNIRQLSPNRCHSIVMAAALVLFATWATMLPPVNAKPGDVNPTDGSFYKEERLLETGSLICTEYPDKKCNNYKYGIFGNVRFEAGNNYQVKTGDGQTRKVHITKVDHYTKSIQWHFKGDHELLIDHFT